MRHPSTDEVPSTGVVGVTVRAFDQDVASATLLGEAVTEADGWYRITFAEAQYLEGDSGYALPAALTQMMMRQAGADARATLVKSGPDLWVGVPGDGDAWLVKSAVVFNATREVTIDLILPLPAVRRGSELEDLIRLILPRLKGIKLQDLTPQQVDFLSKDALTPREQIVALVSAVSLVEQARALAGRHRSELGEMEFPLTAAAYACARAQTGLDLGALLALDQASWLAHLRSAIDRRVIPSLIDLVRDALIKLLVQLRAWSSLEPGLKAARASLGDLLDTLPAACAIGDASARSAVALAWAQSIDPGAESFGERIKGLGLRANQVAALQTTMALNQLSGGNQRLVSALQTRTPEAPDGTLAHLTTLTPSDWISTVAEAASPGDSMVAIEQTAVALSEQIERRYPSLAFANGLASGGLHIDGYPTAKVTKFLRDQPAFDLVTTDVEPYLIAQGLGDDHELKSATLAAQRPLRLGASQSEAARLMGAGLSSAHAIVARGKTTFISSLSDVIPDYRLSAIYDRAHLTAGSAIGLATDIASFLTPASIAVLPGSGESAKALARFPSLATLFGDLSHCACPHCRSVLGPAAYLVDLLQLLSLHEVEGELNRRRPDIAELELSCENTNTEMPYVDLVLEVLENAITFPAVLSLTPFERARLEANNFPQSVLDVLRDTVSWLEGSPSIELGTEPQRMGVPREIRFRSGTRLWSGLLDRAHLFATGGSFKGGSTLTTAIADADEAGILTALDALSASATLLSYLAPEARVPIAKATVQRVEANRQEWRIAIVREVAVTLTPGVTAGALRLANTDGTPIESFQIMPGVLVQLMAADLQNARVPGYLANLLPSLNYRVTWDAARARWLLTANQAFRITRTADRLTLTGLIYTASAATADLTVFPENRNPKAYVVLNEAVFPWALPFDVFVEDVRACLAALGLTRSVLLRALRPAVARASIEDAAEVFQSSVAQLNVVIETNTSADRSAAFWGLQVSGNSLSDPSGDAQAPPIPSDWVGALGRLSVLLDRSQLAMPALMAAASTRYVTAGGGALQLTPDNECRPSRISIGVTKNSLDRLHQLLRLRRITGWQIRDLDAFFDVVVTSGQTLSAADHLIAFANGHELAQRLSVPLRHVAAWLGPLETAPYVDLESAGSPTSPSLYEEVFLSTRVSRAPDRDFALDATGRQLAYISAQGGNTPTYMKLSDKLPDLGRALHVTTSDLMNLIAVAGTQSASPPPISDSLDLPNLVALFRYLTFADANGLSISEFLLLQRLNGAPLFVDGAADPPNVRSRRLLEFAELVDFIRAAGFPVDEIARVVGASPLDEAAAAARFVDQLNWLVGVQTALRAIVPFTETGSTDAAIRALFLGAGWLPSCVDRLMQGASGQPGLTSAVSAEVSVQATTAPAIPAGLPFEVTAGATPGEFTLGVISALMADAADADAAFNALAAVQGLGPMTDAGSPAARLRDAWLRLVSSIGPLAKWVQSIELPRFATPLAFDMEAPQNLANAVIPSELQARITTTTTGLRVRGFLNDAQVRRLKAWSSGATNAAAIAAALDGMIGPPTGLAAPTGRMQFDAVTNELVLVGYATPGELAGLIGGTPVPVVAAAAQTLVTMSDAFVERRPGQMVMGAADFIGLFLRAGTLQECLARLSATLVRPLRRQLAARLICARTGMDQRLFAALDAVAQLAASPFDVLGPLCADEFVMSTIDADVPPAAALVSVEAVERTGLLMQRLKVRPEQRAWFDPAGGFPGVPEAGFIALSAASAAATERWRAMRRALTLFAVRAGVPGQAGTIEDLRTGLAAGSLTAALDIVAHAYHLPEESAEAILQLDGLVASNADLRDPLILRKVVDGARALRRLSCPPATSFSFCNRTLSEIEARAARGTLVAKFGATSGFDALRSAMNRLREKQRAAAVAFLIQRDHAIDSADLHARYLLDVEMGPDVRTSRIKQAISSTQLFVQRWLMHLEDPQLAEADADLRREWEWTKSYRVWEANRKVFLTPENWLEPSLRDDKSHIFRRLESSLLQGQVTSDRAVDALSTYLADLEEISRVTVLAMYREMTAGPRQGTVHLIGRTPNEPSKYFYRQWTMAGALGSWQPWQPVEVMSQSDHVVVFVRNSRPHLAWLQIEKAQPSDSSDPASATPAWAVSLQWSQLGDAGWSAPKKSRNKITHIKEINKDAASTFALRLVSPGANAPSVVSYAGYTDELTRGGDPNSYPQDPQVTPSNRQPGLSFSTQWIDVQVLGTLHDAGGGADRRLLLADATIEAWAEGSIVGGGVQLLQFQWGTSGSPWNITTSAGRGATSLQVDGAYLTIPDLVVHVRASFPGETPQEKQTDALNLFKDNQIQIGFTFDVNGNTSSPGLNALIEGTRKLKMRPFATGVWGLGHSLTWTGHDQLPGDPDLPVADDDGNSSHYNSGFLFPPGVPVKWGQTTIVDAAPAEVFVAATTQEGETAIGYPLYVETESTAASGFVFFDSSNALSFLPAPEIAHVVAQQAIDVEADTLELPSAPLDPSSAAALSTLTLPTTISAPYDRTMAQFERALPQANYDWELFFHIPLMAANALATHQRFAEALRWLHLVFDPTHGSGDTASSPDSAYWRFPPFATAGQGRGMDLLLADFSAGTLDTTTRALLQQQIDFSRRHPFNPHGIARVRTRAYQWMTVLAYLDVLIAWGDQLFRRDTIESINEATQLYLLAAELLGRRPVEMPETPAKRVTASYAALRGQWDEYSNAWIAFADLPFFKATQALLARLQDGGIRVSAASSSDWQQLHRLAQSGALVFCVARNEKLDEYWDTIDDRLFKIRHSQNIDGVERSLALFEPPIDPELLVRAVAAGLDIGSVLNDLFAPLPHYRFTVMLQKAEDFCAEVKALGGLLLSAIEKQDGETLARMRSTHELAVLDLIGDIKRRQADEAEANLRALRQNRSSVELRYRHYQRLMGKDEIQVPAEQAPAVLDAPRLRIAGSTSDRVDADLRGFGLSLEETDQLQQLGEGNQKTLWGSIFQIASAIGHAGPNFSWELGPGASMSMGGSNIGHSIGATGQVFSLLAGQAGFQANRSAIIGGHQRRYDDWVFQSNLAAKELEQIDKQILAALIRVDVAKRELASHTKQVENAQAIDDFLSSKFSRQELYQWMVERLTEVHARAYDAAYDLAKRAERTCGFELGIDTPGIVSFGDWDTLYSGLLAGERLMVDLKRLDQAYMDRNKRELEVTRHVSLNELDPIALLMLQTTGACEFIVPETLFDLDFPGHYFRRLKTVSVSVPCVVGPYASVSGTLTLLENRARTRTSGPYAYQGLDDPRFVYDVVPVQSVATSSAQNDAGLFELTFRDERYLPFEGAGAVSRWRFELPTHVHTFDYATISDLVLHLRYTARDGGAALKDRAATHVTKVLRAELQVASDEQELVRVFSMRHDFPTEWSRLTASSTEKQVVTIDMNRLPFVARGQSVIIWKIGVVAEPVPGATLSDPPLVLHAPAAAYRGTTDPAPAVSLAAGPAGDGAILYEFQLSGEDPDWRPVPVNSTNAWQVEITSQGASYRDIVLVFWWKLA